MVLHLKWCSKLKSFQVFSWATKWVWKPPNVKLFSISTLLASTTFVIIAVINYHVRTWISINGKKFFAKFVKCPKFLKNLSNYFSDSWREAEFEAQLIDLNVYGSLQSATEQRVFCSRDRSQSMMAAKKYNHVSCTHDSYVNSFQQLLFFHFPFRTTQHSNIL